MSKIIEDLKAAGWVEQQARERARRILEAALGEDVS